MTSIPLLRRSTRLAALLIAATAATALAAAQAPAGRPIQPQRPPASQRPAGKPFTLAVTREDGFINVALVARQARVADIARELAAQLRTRIDVGAGLAADVVTVDQPPAPLEAILQAIAPRVVVDYELRQDARPLPIAVRLLAASDPAPPMGGRGTERGVSHGVVISGHTEETPTDDGKDAVSVSGDGQRLSITAKDQPLALVAMIVADTMGVTLDLEYPAGELVAIDVTDAPAEDAALSLSPNVRLEVRVDLGAAERTPMRMRLAAPVAQAAR